MIGKLQRVPLREVWKHEALDFTRWLEENTDILNDLLDISLLGAERERSAGTFSVDLVAEDELGGLVIIENQLGKSDHDHLGKIITYLTVMDAKAAIWIVSDPRPEHIQAITWLNESGSASFYLLKLEAVRIGDSPPAPLLTLIVGPSLESHEAGESKKEFAERYEIRKRFWTGLLDRAKFTTRLHANISPSRDNWIAAGSGISGLVFSYVVRQQDSHVELYIDRDKEPLENKRIFDQFARSRDTIEAAFGAPLEWERLDTKRACRIKYEIEIGGYRSDEARWPEIQTAMIDAMVRLERALKPHIAKLRA